MEVEQIIELAVNLVLGFQPCLTAFLLTAKHDRRRLWTRGPLNALLTLAVLYGCFLAFNAALVLLVLLAIPMNVGLLLKGDE